MIFTKEWTEKRRALEEAAKALADEDRKQILQNAERYRDLWARERQRADLLRKIAGCPDQYVALLDDTVSSILRAPPPKE